MIESVIILGKVAVVCGVGFGIATGFEWFSDLQIKPKNKVISIGSDKEVDSNDNKVKNFKQQIKSEG